MHLAVKNICDSKERPRKKTPEPTIKSAGKKLD